MNLFLIGFMGSGKTTAGKKLAKKLNLEFIDMDNYLEKQQNRTINEIFATDGEGKFREIERNILNELLQKDNILVGTGGGAPCFFDNMKQMNEKALTLYLQLPPKALAHRLRNAKAERPLIKNKTENELIDFIEKTLEKREPFYTQAHIIINSHNLNVEETVNLIVEKI